MDELGDRRCRGRAGHGCRTLQGARHPQRILSHPQGLACTIPCSVVGYVRSTPDHAYRHELALLIRRRAAAVAECRQAAGSRAATSLSCACAIDGARRAMTDCVRWRAASTAPSLVPFRGFTLPLWLLLNAHPPSDRRERSPPQKQGAPFCAPQVSPAGLSEARSAAEPAGEREDFRTRGSCLFVSPTGLTRQARVPKARSARPSGVAGRPRAAAEFARTCGSIQQAGRKCSRTPHLTMRANERQRRYRAT